MTQRELEQKDYELRSFIADKIKDIQMQGNSMKNPEDKTRNLQTLTRIADCISDIKRTYVELERLDGEDPEEDEQNELLNNNFA